MQDLFTMIKLIIAILTELICSCSVSITQKDQSLSNMASDNKSLLGGWQEDGVFGWRVIFTILY